MSDAAADRVRREERSVAAAAIVVGTLLAAMAIGLRDVAGRTRASLDAQETRLATLDELLQEDGGIDAASEEQLDEIAALFPGRRLVWTRRDGASYLTFAADAPPPDDHGDGVPPR